MGRDAVGKPHIASDNGTFADCDPAQEGGVAVDGDIVLDDGVARNVPWLSRFVVLEILRAYSHSLVKRDPVPNDRGLTDDDARPVVDGEMVADLGLWMNVDSRGGMGIFHL